MTSKKYAFLAAILGMVAFSPEVQAGSQELDYTGCRNAEFTLLSQSDEMTVLGIDLKGVDRSNHENKLFDGFSHRCNGVYMIRGDETAGNGFCKYLAPDGDYTLLQWRNTGKRGTGTWEFLEGSGKFKGVKGGGDYETVMRAKPITPGSLQFCIRVTGTLELPE